MFYGVQGDGGGSQGPNKIQAGHCQPPRPIRANYRLLCNLTVSCRSLSLPCKSQSTQAFESDSQGLSGSLCMCHRPQLLCPGSATTIETCLVCVYVYDFTPAPSLRRDRCPGDSTEPPDMVTSQGRGQVWFLFASGLDCGSKTCHHHPQTEPSRAPMGSWIVTQVSQSSLGALLSIL